MADGQQQQQRLAYLDAQIDEARANLAGAVSAEDRSACLQIQLSLQREREALVVGAGETEDTIARVIVAVMGLDEEVCAGLLQLPQGLQKRALKMHAGAAGDVAAAAGRTAFEALNTSLPQGTTDLIQSSSSSTPASRIRPSEVLAWEHVAPGHADSLGRAILAHQDSADTQHRRLTKSPDTLMVQMNSEAAVAGSLQSWVAEPLTILAQQVSAGASWDQLPPEEIIQDALIFAGAHDAEGQLQTAAVTTRFGRLSRPPSATSQPQGCSSGGRRHKMDFVLSVQDDAPQEQPSEAVQRGPKRRCVCVGEVKKPGELLSSVEILPDLVAAYQQQDSDRHRQASAALDQIYTYLQLWRMCYGFISCWFGTWLVYCPPQQRHKLYVSAPYSASSAAPAVTVLGALAWLQDQALKVDPASVDDYQPAATGQAGGGKGSPGSSAPASEASPSSEEPWVPDQQGPHDERDRRSGGGSKGAGGSSSKPQQPGGKVTLLLQHKLHQGSAGAVVVGTYGGVPSVVKLLGPDRHGLAAFEIETRVYSRLAAVQGTVVPRLLGIGSLPGGVVFIATSRVDGVPLSSLATVPTATANSALEALARLHRECEGFLHGDIRLANVMVLAGPLSDVSPRCMLLDFGRSRVDGSKAEQRREHMALKKLLGA